MSQADLAQILNQIVIFETTDLKRAWKAASSSWYQIPDYKFSFSNFQFVF